MDFFFWELVKCCGSWLQIGYIKGEIMRFFHLADLHIGKQLHQYSMKKEQEDILNKIVRKAQEEKPDAIVIAGDIYDKSVPSAEAVHLFDKFLTDITELTPEIAVLLISGNHDSPERLNYASEILSKHQVYISGMPPQTEEEHLKKVVLKDEYGVVNFYLMPFIKPFYVRNLWQDDGGVTYEEAVRRILEREEIDKKERNVLVAHQFFVASGEKPETSESEMAVVGGIDEVDIRVLLPFTYAALGHIHRPQKIGKPYYRYSGTPLKYSISEEKHHKSITCVELKEAGSEPVITEIPLEPLRDVRVLRGSLEEVLAQATTENKDDFLSITITDEMEPYQFNERLKEVYSHILEIRVDNTRTRTILTEAEEDFKVKTPLEICMQFFSEMQGREMTEEEETIVKEVLNEGGLES